MPTLHERITKGLDLLTAGLTPFVERELKAVYRDSWAAAARDSFRDERAASRSGSGSWDAHALLTVMWDQWNRVFRFRLGPAERSLVSELRDFRNRWAHQSRFTFDDAYRALDSVERLLRAAGAPECETAARERREVMRHEFGRETRAAYQKSQANRKRRQDMLLYGACCASIVFAIFQSLGPRAWFLAVVVVVVFLFLGWHRATSSQPVLFGAHECAVCGKIIYRDTCPYCEPDSLTQEDSRRTESARAGRRTPAEALRAEFEEPEAVGAARV